jgi:hypothetical protein
MFKPGYAVLEQEKFLSIVYCGCPLMSPADFQKLSDSAFLTQLVVPDALLSLYASTIPPAFSPGGLESSMLWT